MNGIQDKGGSVVLGATGMLWAPNLDNTNVLFPPDADIAVVAKTLADVTLVATASTVTHAQEATTLADATLVAAAGVLTHAQLATSFADATLIATGTVSGGPITGTLAVTLGDVALVAIASGLGTAQPAARGGGLPIPRHLRSVPRVRLPKFPPQPSPKIIAEATVHLQAVTLAAAFTLTPSLRVLERQRRVLAEQLLLAA